jgi:hypothetical protein
MSRDLATKYGFRMCKTVDESLTLGGATLAVDGVLCIGEHGKYPTNDKGQVLYPRRRFFEQVTNVFARTKKSVPVFTDKHLAATWDDAKWMYDRSRGTVRARSRWLVDPGDVAAAGAEVADRLRTDGRGADRLRSVRGLRLPRAGRFAVHGGTGRAARPG